MIRPATLAALALSFLTAFAVGQLGLLVTEPAVVTDQLPVNVPYAEAIAREFYSGIDAWIDSGDRKLDRVVSPAFVDHAATGAADRDRSAFFAQLASIGATYPDLHFEISQIETAGAMVLVDLTSAVDPGAPLPGWSLTLSLPENSREILRIEKHLVVERWSGGDRWPSGLWSTDQTVPVGAAQLRQTSMQCFELDASADVVFPFSGTVVLMVETGRMRVDPAGYDLAGSSQPVYQSIDEGAVRIVEAAGSLQVRNMAGSTTRFWTFGLDQLLPPVLPADATSSTPPIVVQEIARVSGVDAFPLEHARLLVSGITVPVGTELRPSHGGTHAVAVLGGQLQGVTDEETVYYALDATSYRPLDGVETAVAGQGFVSLSKGSATYRVTGNRPARLLLLSIVPVGQPEVRPVRTGPG